MNSNFTFLFSFWGTSSSDPIPGICPRPYWGTEVPQTLWFRPFYKISDAPLWTPSIVKYWVCRWWNLSQLPFLIQRHQCCHNCCHHEPYFTLIYTKSSVGWGSATDPAGEFRANPGLLAGFRGPYSKGRKRGIWRGWKRIGRKRRKVRGREKSRTSCTKAIFRLWICLKSTK